MFDTEKFICEIELRPAIWDVRSKSYSNKTEKTKAWEEICCSFIDNFENNLKIYCYHFANLALGDNERLPLTEHLLSGVSREVYGAAYVAFVAKALTKAIPPL